MKAHNKKRISKRFDKKTNAATEVIVVFLTIFSLIAYPMLLPLFSVKASDSSVEQDSQASSSESESSKSKDENTDKSNEKTDSELQKNDSDSKPSSPSKEMESDTEKTKDDQNSASQPDSIPETSAADQSSAQTEPAVNQNADDKNGSCICKDTQSDNSEQNSACCQKNTTENINDVTATTVTSNVANTGNNTAIDDSTTQKYQDSSRDQSVKDPRNDSTDASQDKTLPLENVSKTDVSIDNSNIVMTNPNSGLVYSADSQTLPPATSIATGDAAVDSTIINETNTNIVADNYAEISTDITGDQIDDINLLEQFQALLQKGLDNDDMKKILEIYNTNNANLTNIADAQANSGNNIIESDNNGSSSDSITTGDATAAANIINIINRNLVGNSWLFAIINVLGTWSGNLILPGQDLLKIQGSTDNYDVTNINNASIENDATANAVTGNNSIDGSKISTITTGDAQSATDIETVANTNITKNNWFFLMINNMGSWTGKILGWDEATQSTKEIFSFDFGSLTDGSQQTNSDSSIIKVINKNSAEVSNSAYAQANTGSNSIINGAKNTISDIETGAATAKANIFNLINTNIVGNNWMFAIVNVMGSWTGNVIFAYPDLAISIDSDNHDHILAGTDSAFTITYKNIGKAASENTVVRIQLPKGIMNFSDGSSITTQELDGLKPGEQKTFKVTAAASQIDEAEATSKIFASVSTKTAEKETGNNSAEENVTVDSPSDSSENISSKLKIKREDASVQFSSNGEILTHSITIQNTGKSPLHAVVLRDSTIDPAGNTVSKNEWSIGDLDEGKKVQVKYQMLVDNTAKTGTYTNNARSYGLDYQDKKISSNVSSTESYVYAQLTMDSNINTDDNERLLIPIANADSIDQNPNEQIADWNMTGSNKYDWGWVLLLLLFAYAFAYRYKIENSIEAKKIPIRRLSTKKI